ncbi:MAG TPA: hypothetical protein VGS41_09600, partial [Chthonomonadales bacterium]|nr:hypothetical protein [Chthonomonadales bacterium]
DSQLDRLSRLRTRHKTSFCLAAERRETCPQDSKTFRLAPARGHGAGQALAPWRESVYWIGRSEPAQESRESRTYPTERPEDLVYGTRIGRSLASLETIAAPCVILAASLAYALTGSLMRAAAALSIRFATAERTLERPITRRALELSRLEGVFFRSGRSAERLCEMSALLVAAESSAGQSNRATGGSMTAFAPEANPTYHRASRTYRPRSNAPSARWCEDAIAAWSCLGPDSTSPQGFDRVYGVLCFLPEGNQYAASITLYPLTEPPDEAPDVLFTRSGFTGPGIALARSWQMESHLRSNLSLVMGPAMVGIAALFSGLIAPLNVLSIRCAVAAVTALRFLRSPDVPARDLPGRLITVAQ